MNRLFIFAASLLFSVQAFAQSDPFYFIQVSDPQFGMLEANKEFSKETKLMEQAVASINKLDPEFVVITGDMANDGKDAKQIREFKRISNQIKKSIPVYVLPGNHDLSQGADDESVRAYIDEYGYDCFSFQVKNCCFIGLNTSIIFADRKEKEQSQFVWMEKVLENSQKCDHRILFGHHPFFVKTPDEPDKYENIPLTKRKAYLDFFNKYNVDGMYAGHLHYNSSGNYGNFRMTVTNALCYPIGKDKIGLRIVKVYKDRIESDYYDLDHIPEQINL